MSLSQVTDPMTGSDLQGAHSPEKISIQIDD